MTTYKDAGVDIDAQDKAISGIKKMVKDTNIPGVLSKVGNFGGLFEIGKLGMKNPVLVSSADGVGTKVKLASLKEKFDTVGQDLVNHCVNDILVQGAIPLFFMDYVAASKLKPEQIVDVVKGLTIACKENKMTLLGGEMAEMPGVYNEGHFDVAGVIVGVVEKDNLVDGSSISEGDIVVGLPSSGLQTNGYSLAIKVFSDILEKKAEELMTVHQSFLPVIKPLLGTGVIKGMAHITGGGLVDNIPRVLPKGVSVSINKSSWEVPSIFKEIQELGDVPVDDMFRTFNMGIGFVVIVDKKDVSKIKNGIVIGEVVKGNKEVNLID